MRAISTLPCMETAYCGQCSTRTPSEHLILCGDCDNVVCLAHVTQRQENLGVTTLNAGNMQLVLEKSICDDCHHERQKKWERDNPSLSTTTTTKNELPLPATTYAHALTKNLAVAPVIEKKHLMEEPIVEKEEEENPDGWIYYMEKNFDEPTQAYPDVLWGNNDPIYFPEQPNWDEEIEYDRACTMFKALSVENIDEEKQKKTLWIECDCVCDGIGFFSIGCNPILGKL